MNAPPEDALVQVDANARLHFGVLDLRGDLGRWFGGIGASAPGPTLRVSVRPAPRLEVRGEDAGRASEFARRVLSHFGIRDGVDLVVDRALPSHVGLGSGTQLALAIARAIAELHDLESDTFSLAKAIGRGRRSAVGAYTFGGGGLVVEGGHRDGSEGLAPLIARHPFPEAWWSVVAVPSTSRGLSGVAEEAAFGRLRPPSEADVSRVAHLALMGLLPGLVEGDLQTFGRALTEIQTITGRWFAPVQGGTFASAETAELVGEMTRRGAVGVGQSSWGPAVYGILGDEDSGRRCARGVGDWMGGRGQTFAGPFPRDGARVRRQVPSARSVPGMSSG